MVCILKIDDQVRAGLCGVLRKSEESWGVMKSSVTIGVGGSQTAALRC